MRSTIKVGTCGMLLGAAVALAGCGGSNDDIGNVFGATGKFRVVNGISDSSAISLNASGLPTDFGDVSVNTASGFRSVPASTFKANVTVKTTSGSQPTFSLDNIAVSSGQETTAYFPGKISDNSFATAGFSIQNGVGSIANGNFEATVVHAASNAQATVDVYLTAPGAALGSAIKVNYRGSTTPTQIAAGTYQIRVALDSAPTSIIFDSGSSGVALAAGSRLQIAALNETDSSRNSPIRLLVIDSNSNSTTLQNSP